MDDFERIMVEDAIEKGWFRYTSIEFGLPSGRKFRYQMQDYPFRVFASEAELVALCCRIIKDKYRVVVQFEVVRPESACNSRAAGSKLYHHPRAMARRTLPGEVSGDLRRFQDQRRARASCSAAPPHLHPQ